MSLDEGSTFADYTIVRRLGSGGMGEVGMQQTGQPRRVCRRDVVRSNGLP